MKLDKRITTIDDLHINQYVCAFTGKQNRNNGRVLRGKVVEINKRSGRFYMSGVGFFQAGNYSEKITSYGLYFGEYKVFLLDGVELPIIPEPEEIKYTLKYKCDSLDELFNNHCFNTYIDSMAPTLSDNYWSNWENTYIPLETNI